MGYTIKIRKMSEEKEANIESMDIEMLWDLFIFSIFCWGLLKKREIIIFK